MAGFNHVKRCVELADRDIVFAMEDRLVAKALLDRLSAVSKPNDGGPKILLVFARMASQACDWIDGDLRIEIAGDAETSTIEVLTDLGAGMRERVLPSFAVRVPLEEFSRAVERVPHMIEPLTVAAKSAKRIVLSATEEVRKSSLPPAMVEIDRESLYERADLSSAKVPVIAPPPPSSRAMPVSKSTPRMEAVVPPPAAPPGPPHPAPQIRPKGPAVVKKTDLAGSMPAPAIVKRADASMPAPAIKKTDAAASMPAPAIAKKAEPAASAPAARPQIQPFAKFVPPGAKPKTKSQPPAQAKAKSVPPKAKTVPPKAKSVPPKAKSVPPPKGKTVPPPKGKTVPPPGRSMPPKASRAPRMLSEPPDEEQIDTGWDDES